MWKKKIGLNKPKATGLEPDASHLLQSRKATRKRTFYRVS